MRFLLVIAIAYLLGSIPFGYLIVRAKKGGDIRQTGSGGTGATNVSRRAGKMAGVVTLLLDALKGTTAVLIAKALASGASDAAWIVALAAIAVMVGHIFPVWLGFRGGKGVATGVGVFLALAPLAVGVAGLLFAIIVWTTRYVSLGSIAGAVTIPIFIWLQSVVWGPVGNVGPLLAPAICGALLIVFAHRENIARLVSGSESKFR
ncbi:MAG TPA: glycerol-3-phosphate 1-O-acyltransferase PlsY [Pyrinomonadaceae bacterium]|nr:glycerol-3-phosphate 1-O-acyltransferase PlsY [Pyrinomonadaceae bacterium]